MTIVDSDYSFICVNIRVYGKYCDSAVVKETVFRKLPETNRLDMPHTKSVITNYNVPYILVGYQAFDLSINFLKPYGN